MKKITFSFLVLIWLCSNIQMLAQERTLQVREDGVYMYVDQFPERPMVSKENWIRVIQPNLKQPELFSQTF